MLFKHFTLKEKILLACQSIVFLCLFLYSFTQVDLGLTIARNPFLRDIVMAFQHIGYFQRPLSSLFYIVLLSLLTLFYCLMLFFAHRKTLSRKFVWTTIFTAAILLTFSYSAFSYDIFNYVFDAKILTHYHANPYLHKALDYQGDPMLGFMHWTHRTYPYGPFWLVLTVPLSFIGLQYFLPTFFLFKLLMSLSFLGTVWAIGKILKKLFPEREIFGLVFFALNPLVLIECLVSAHLDIVMMFFAVYGFFLVLSQKEIKGYLALIVSIGIKFLTGILVPVYLFITFMLRKKKKFPWETIFVICLVLLLGGVILESHQSGNFQPWYLLAPLSFIVFLKPRYYVVIPTVVISTASLFMYLPYLYLGNWDPPVPQILQQIMIMGYSFSFCLPSVYFLYRQIVLFKAKRGHKK